MTATFSQIISYTGLESALSGEGTYTPLHEKSRSVKTSQSAVYAPIRCLLRQLVRTRWTSTHLEDRVGPEVTPGRYRSLDHLATLLPSPLNSVRH
jgi:hypothetical protein